MSEQIDPNGFGKDVERALERVDDLPENANAGWRREKLGDDRRKIREYVYGVEDSLASRTLRTRIGRLRRIAEQTETSLSKIDSKTTITTALGKMSRERGWKTSETKRNYIKALKGFYRFHEKPELAEELNEFVRENLNVPSTEDVDEDKVLWKEEFDALLEHAKTSRERAIVSTLWEGAYRATALCALMVGSYERQGDTHAIVTTPEHMGSKDADAQQKPMTFSRGYIDRWLQNDHPCPDDDDAALFCKVRNNAEQAGEHITTQYLRRILKDIARRTDDDDLVEKTTPHAFRHGRVTYLAQNDYTERLIEHNLDWSRDTAQHRRYEHLQQEDKVNALLRNAGIEPEASRKKRRQPTAHGATRLCWNRRTSARCAASKSTTKSQTGFSFIGACPGAGTIRSWSDLRTNPRRHHRSTHSRRTATTTQCDNWLVAWLRLFSIRTSVIGTTYSERRPSRCWIGCRNKRLTSGTTPNTKRSTTWEIPELSQKNWSLLSTN